MTPLRACDLVPGRIYLSPSGRLCLLQQPKTHGISNTSYLFAYLTRNGNASEDEGFALSTANERAIAAMREAPAPSAEFAMRFGVAG